MMRKIVKTFQISGTVENFFLLSDFYSKSKVSHYVHTFRGSDPSPEDAFNKYIVKIRKSNDERCENYGTHKVEEIHNDISKVCYTQWFHVFENIFQQCNAKIVNFYGEGCEKHP